MDKTARIWNAKTGAALSPPLPHEGAVEQASFSPDGLRLLTASADGTARLWDAHTGAALGVLPLSATGAVASAVFHPAGDRVLLAGEAADEPGDSPDKIGMAQSWRIPPYPEPRPTLPIPPGLLRTAAKVLALLAVALAAFSAWRSQHRLRARHDRHAPRGKVQA
ncbi:MAG: WD40 repeat domain-containing protein [Candidatus Methylumidiphilus sp.]